MNRFLCFLTGLVFLLTCVPLRAQWSGGVDLAGGIGGMEGSVVNDDAPMFHGLLDGAFRLNYNSDKFCWSARVYGSWEPNTTDNARLQYKNEQLSIVYKAATTKPLLQSRSLQVCGQTFFGHPHPTEKFRYGFCISTLTTEPATKP